MQHACYRAHRENASNAGMWLILLALLTSLLPLLFAFGARAEGNWIMDSPKITSKLNGPSVTAFPDPTTTGDIVIVTDDSAIGACDSAAGSARSLCRYN